MPRQIPLLMLVCCLLSACASGPQPTLVQQAPQIQPIKVPPPASLTQPPQPLPQPTSGLLPDLELNHRQVTQAYHQLAAQLCALLLTLEIEHRECLPYLPKPAGSDAQPRRRGD
jgi:hypothetical protein